MTTSLFDTDLSSAPVVVPGAPATFLQNVFACSSFLNPQLYLGLIDHPSGGPPPIPLQPMQVWFPLAPGGVVNWTPLGYPPPNIGFRFSQGLWLVLSDTPAGYTQNVANVIHAWINYNSGQA